MLSLLFIPPLAAAQENGNSQLPKTEADPETPDRRSPPERDIEMQPMSDMDPGQMQQMRTGNGRQMSMKPPKTLIEEIENHETSGTSAEPNSTPTPMWTTVKGDWMVMFHANAFVTDEQQSSSRGGDRFFSTNWFMPMAQRALGPGTLTVRTMLSLEPATVTDRRYPLLFQGSAWCER